MAQTKVVSYSELDAARQCRFKHHLAYRERWRGQETKQTLSRGKMFHEVMEAHYRVLAAGGDLQDAWDYIKTTGLLFDLKTAQADEDQERVLWMYHGYIENYGLEERWEILAVEVRHELWLPTETGHRSSFKMKGTIDLLVKDNKMGGIWGVDHKTGKNLPKEKELDLDDQFGIYTWLLQRSGLPIRGFIHNAVRSEKLKTREMQPSERFLRRPTVRQDVEMKTMVQEVLDTFRSVYRPTGREFPPRSPDTSSPSRCGWRCDFTEPCLASRKGRDVREALAEFGFIIDETRH